MKNISTFHDEDKNKSKNAKERQPLKTGYSSKEFNGLKTNFTMIKGKRGGTRKNMLKQDIKKNANCPSGEHGFHYHKADNNPKAPHTKNGRVYHFRKQLRKSGVHVKKKFQRKHSSINLMGKQTDLPSSSKPLHANLQAGKFRQHTGDKGSQRGDSGARATANGGSEGGGTGRQGGGSRSARRLQGSGGGNQGFGSGGDDPDDHNNRKTREYGNGHKCNTTDDENGDDDKSEKKAYSKGNGNCLKRNSHQHNEAHAKHAPASALPNLPKPNWDASTLRQRQAKELMFQDDPPGSSQTSPLKLFLPPVSSQNERVDLHGHRRDSAPSLTSFAPGISYDPVLTTDIMVPCSTPVPNTVAGNGLNSADQSSRKHGVISITQLCEIIGSATIDANVPSGLFEQFNICLTKWMHDLSFGLRELNDATEVGNMVSDSTLAINSSTSTCGVTATSADGSLLQPPGIEKTPPKLCNASESPSSSLSCTVCLMVSGLVTHLSHCRQPQCMQCAQILNLMTQHARSCVGKNRPQHRITSSDLCYKICKKAGWNSENISCDSASFKGKIQKYCDKALGKSSKNLASSKEFETTSSIGIGEMESVRDNDGLSSGANSIALLSLSGNPVALESGGSFPEKSSLTPIGQLGRDPDSFVSVASEAAASSVPLTLSQHVTTSNGQIGALTHLATSIGSKSLRSLTRKSSYRSPAIPQPIEEVSTAAEEELVAAEGQSGQNDTDIRQFIYRRFPLKGTDPYDTQPTFGDKKGYESMPQGILHDQEQFFSFGNRAVGVPGIGEVVFGNHKQLRLVAGFWEKKREDCERTGTTPPYQHREEGVILSQYKGHFSILRTRYQKHHQWERVAHLGNGMSGKCHLVTDLKTEFKFCCKKVHLLKYTKEEVNIWSELDHPFIVKLYGAIRNGVKIYIFCEFIDGGSLATCIEEQRHLGQRFSHWAAINYFHQLLKILAYLQSKDVLHEDIKADNILLRNGCTYIALTDFGTCRRLCDPKELLHKSPLGSPAHWSPEKAASQGHGFPSDLWAGVCVLIHMLSGDPPWMRRFMKSATILNFIIYSREPPLEDVPQNVQPMVRDLIASGLVKDPVQRPRADKLLGHEAFNILENRQPERYYSSLGGQSQAALLSKVHDIEKAQKILYRTEIATGPYQESAGPADNSRVKRDIETETTGPTEEENSTGKAFAHITTEEEEILPSINFNLELERPSEVLREDGERSEQNLSDSRRENIPRRLNEATAHFPRQNSSAKKDMGNSEEKHVSSGNKPQPIPDLDALLSSLFVPDENKAFYHDEVPDGAEALKQSTVKQQQLQVYVPESRKENQLPNLSIFTVDLSDGSGQGGSATLTPRSLFEAVAENQSSSSQHAVSSITDGELRLALSSAVVAENFNGTSFILSSESEYTSADLFDQGSYAGPETIVNGSASYEKEPCVTPTNPLHFQGAGNPSHNAFGASLSSQSLSTNLQQRKPNHLKLQLSPTNSGLTVSAHGAGDSSSSNERGSRAASNKSNLRTQSHRTPSTGRLSATSSSGRHGGSSTSGSRTSPLPFRFNTPGSSSVLEEQDKMLQLLKAEHESLSSSGSELYTEDQVPTQADDLSSAMAENWQLALSKLQENIEISSLEGHALQLYDENSMQVVLPVHFMDTPINKRQLIESISGRMSNQYGHFSLLHMDKSPLNLSTPLEVHKLLVRQLPGPQKGCLCDSCRSQF